MDTFLAILRPLNEALAYATPVPQVVLNHQTGLAGGLSAYIPLVGIAGDGFTWTASLLSAGGCPSPVLPALLHTGYTCAMHSTMVGQLVHFASQGRWMDGTGGENKAGDGPISSLFPYRLVNSAMIGTAVALAVGTTVAGVGGWRAASCWGEPVFLADLASAFFYTVSRLPQVWLNHQRRSGRGLSLGMLGLLAGVNALHLLEMGVSAVASGSLEATPREMVWIVQRLIAIPIDVVMIVQCLRGRGRVG